MCLVLLVFLEIVFDKRDLQKDNLVLKSATKFSDVVRCPKSMLMIGKRKRRTGWANI